MGVGWELAVVGVAAVGEVVVVGIEVVVGGIEVVVVEVAEEGIGAAVVAAVQGIDLQGIVHQGNLLGTDPQESHLGNHLGIDHQENHQGIHLGNLLLGTDLLERNFPA